MIRVVRETIIERKSEEKRLRREKKRRRRNTGKRGPYAGIKRKDRKKEGDKGHPPLFHRGTVQPL